MTYKCFRENAEKVIEQNKMFIEKEYESYIKKFQKKGYIFDIKYRLVKAQKGKRNNKLNYEIIASIYPINKSKKQAISEYCFKAFKGTVISFNSDGKYEYASNKTFKRIIELQLFLLSHNMTNEENCIDLIIKMFFPHYIESAKDTFRGKDISLLRLIIIEVLPVLIVSVFVIRFIVTHPDASFWMLWW